MLDEYRKDSFTLRAIIFVTINDYPALFILSGQFKGKVGCVVCIDGTHYMSLNASKKIVYMRQRRFLSKGHKYRLKKMDKYFDYNDERNSDAPLGNSKGQSVFKIVSNIKFVFGKKTEDRKTRKMSNQLQGQHSRRSPFSLSICHTGKTWIYNTRSMVCTSRRMCSKV